MTAVAWFIAGASWSIVLGALIKLGWTDHKRRERKKSIEEIIDAYEKEWENWYG